MIQLFGENRERKNQIKLLFYSVFTSRISKNANNIELINAKRRPEQGLSPRSGLFSFIFLISAKRNAKQNLRGHRISNKIKVLLEPDIRAMVDLAGVEPALPNQDGGSLFRANQRRPMVLGVAPERRIGVAIQPIRYELIAALDYSFAPSRALAFREGYILTK